MREPARELAMQSRITSSGKRSGVPLTWHVEPGSRRSAAIFEPAKGSDHACPDWLLEELDVRPLDAVPLRLFKDLGLALLMEGGETIWRSF
jgi:hypothetical protein